VGDTNSDQNQREILIVLIVVLKKEGKKALLNCLLLKSSISRRVKHKSIHRWHVGAAADLGADLDAGLDGDRFVMQSPSRRARMTQ
jgi:hypothetical protein